MDSAVGFDAKGSLCDCMKRLQAASYRYTMQNSIIKTFRHKGLKAFFDKGSMAGIPAADAPKFAAMLRRLNETTDAQGMNLPG